MKQRIKELRFVDSSKLNNDERNWRTHPSRQKQALTDMLKKVGIVDAVIAREDKDGKLILIDGHLRKATIKGKVPVLIVDVNRQEAGQIMASLDPLSALAGSDTKMLESLINEVAVQADDANLLNDIASDFLPAPDRNAEWDGMPEFDNPGIEGFRSIKVTFQNQEDVDDFFSKLGVAPTEARFMSYPDNKPIKNDKVYGE